MIQLTKNAEDCDWSNSKAKLIVFKEKLNCKCVNKGKCKNILKEDWFNNLKSQTYLKKETNSITLTKKESKNGFEMVGAVQLLTNFEKSLINQFQKPNIFKGKSKIYYIIISEKRSRKNMLKWLSWPLAQKCW